jgi:Ca2+-binding EF-hand superfamily protein
MFSGAVFTAPVPAPDKRVEEVMNTMKLEKKDIAMLWKRFSQYDKDKSGTIDVEEFYRMIHEKKNVFADSIFDLIDMDSTEGTMDFGEYPFQKH